MDRSVSMSNLYIPCDKKVQGRESGEHYAKRNLPHRFRLISNNMATGMYTVGYIMLKNIC